jgi:tetratricopeptide (TPR) repeat protein
MHITLFPLLLLSGGADADSEMLDQLASRLGECRRRFDDAGLEEVASRLLALERAGDDGFRLHTLIAEAYLRRANMRRTERTIRTLEPAVVKAYRKRQADWGAAGLPHARRALELASSDPERALAERLCGELHVHQITGPVAGFVNGPKALEHIGRALALAPEDSECLRARGLMFLYNPPFNGGDVDRAVETFRDCAAKRPDGDEYQVYLALALRKKKSLVRAELAAKKALRINPLNADARALVAEIGAELRPDAGERDGAPRGQGKETSE